MGDALGDDKMVTHGLWNADATMKMKHRRGERAITQTTLY